MTFFIMMAVNPAVQEKAQTQIDTVVGQDRLPSMDDRPLLPFIDAILRETLRYEPVGPLGECPIPWLFLVVDLFELYSDSSCCRGRRCV